MTEKNREILSRAIQDMELRSPKASSWDHIAEGLDNLDAAAFSSQAGSRLPLHKAPPEAWKSIAKSLPPASGSFFGTITGKIISGLILTGIVIVSFLLIPAEDQDNIQPQLEVVAKDVQPEDIIEETAAEGNAHAMELPAIKDELSQVKQDAEITLPSLTESPTQPSPADKPVENLLLTEASERNSLNRTPSLLPGPIYFPSPPMFLLEERDGENKQIIPPEYYDKTRFETQFKAGAYYALNQFQQIEQENMSIPLSISSLGLDFVVEKHRWILKTGFEYLGWKEYGDYRIDYRQNQMVYQYNYVDSAFINTFSGQVTYFTSDRQVFDSVSGQRSEQASYRYRILQIPLLAGYRIIERGNFNISIIAGLGIDIRISGKQFTPVFSEEDASITEVSNSLQYRAINNWRVIGGLGLAYSLDKRWEIYVEPSYQQYMKPLYAPENTKGMGLFKVKAGIHFTF